MYGFVTNAVIPDMSMVWKKAAELCICSFLTKFCVQLLLSLQDPPDSNTMLLRQLLFTWTRQIETLCCQVPTMILALFPRN